MAEIFEFEDDTFPSGNSSMTLTHERSSSSHRQYLNDPAYSEMDELCDTVAELQTDSPVRTRPISISNTKRRGSSSGSFHPGSAEGRSGKSFEIGIKSPFVSSFAESMCYNNSPATENIKETVLSSYDSTGKAINGQSESVIFDSESSGRKVYPSDFESLKVLGQGTYGKVLLVKEKRTGRLFAQKQLKKASMIVEEKTIQQTKTEREILESVRHPYIVKLFYAMQDREKLYLILEYVQGGELFTYLANRSMLSEETSAFYAAEMILALYHLHVNVGVVYRDLKPENCLLDSDGHLVLTDFGLSKVATDSDASCRTFLGTPEFMAPEVLEGSEYDYAVDWWSLGAVLYDMLTGNPPFPGDDYQVILKKIWRTKRIEFPFYLTRDAQNFISRLLTRDPKKRLGFKDIDKIKSHSFFSSIDWEKLEARDPSIIPPIIPLITDPILAENFSTDFTDMPLSPPGHDSPLAIPISSNRNSGENNLSLDDITDGTNGGNHPFKGFSFTASQSFIDYAF